MKQKFRPLRGIDISIELLSKLEYVFEQKIKILEKAANNSSSNWEAFASLNNTMKEEQEEELKFLKCILLINFRLKQEFCKHLKKDHNVCDGTKYCMNCNLTL